MGHRAAQFSNWTQEWEATHSNQKLARRARRTWVMMPFGDGLNMLKLHMLTLARVVTGFLITEARVTHQRNAAKPAVLSEAMARGDLPSWLQQMIRVRIVDLHLAATTGHCSTWTTSYHRTRCVDMWQRYHLLGLLVEVAQPEDLAILTDFDEIARPSIVKALATCYPFPEQSTADDNRLSKYILRASHYEFGMHCHRAKPWDNGPHVFAVHYLLNRFVKRQDKEPHRPVSEKLSEAAEWSALRMQTRFSAPLLVGSDAQPAAWHFSSFGEPADIKHKFESWSHAQRFLTRVEQQYLQRLACADAPSSNADTVQGNRTAARSPSCPDPSQPIGPRPQPKGFRKNGHERDALSAARLERCAWGCIDPYPGPSRSYEGAKSVPPCLTLNTSGGRGAHGKLGLRLWQRPDASTLPPSFSKSPYAELLFGYFDRRTEGNSVRVVS